MQRSISRRGFAAQTTAGLAGLLSGAVAPGSPLAAAEPASGDQRLTVLGLNALARSADGDYFVNGHRGASLIAADLLCTQNNLDQPARERITELFDLNWASTPLCQPFPEEEPAPGDLTRIADALVAGGDVLRQVGHNAIFAMLAIKAFRMVPAAATPQRIDGVCKLIGSFTPWRDGPPDPAVDPPPFQDSEAAARFILREAIDAVDRFAGFGQGFAGHMLTFGQALVELAAMGDVELAESCRTAFRKYVTVTRRGPGPDDRRIADHRPSPLRPRDTAYWTARSAKSLEIGHVFKYPYSYYDLLQRANDPALQAAWDEQAWHLF